MPNKINRGPEIYDPDALKVEYSRREREEMTRYISGRKDRGNRKFSLRILLLDLVLLCIIGGIIYPFIVTTNKRGTLDSIRYDLSLRTDETTLYISLTMENPPDGPPQESVEADFILNGTLARTISDLSPKPGEQRVIRFKTPRGEEKIEVRTILRQGEGRLELNAVSSPM